MTERKVAPCFVCGHAASELDDFERGVHEYKVFELWGQEIVLCDFCCDADFGSYFPEYWGLPPGTNSEYPLNLMGPLQEPKIAWDAYCPNCDHRLAFLKVLAAARRINAAQQPVVCG